MSVTATHGLEVGPAPAHEGDLLRFLACGSVDDGKSTLIGRLLYDAGLLFEDQLAALRQDSRKYGSAGDGIDFALLLDGLETEREQRITIDVAHRYFATARRSFIVADSPGHEQYTRNMVTGASTSDLAVILVDARKGISPQTRRHTTICALLGILDVVLAVNKMDLVAYSRDAFEPITAEYLSFAEKLGFASVQAIPLSARFGDNVNTRSAMMPWYAGPPLLDYLETVDIRPEPAAKPFRFSAQWVNRPNQDFRGIAGTVLSGTIAPGDSIVAADSGAVSHVARIVTAGGDLPSACAGDAVTLTLADDIDVARGALLAPPHQRPPVADQFAAHLIWMGTEPLLPGRSYLMRIGNRWTPATVSAIKHKLDITRLESLAARTLLLNEIGVCNLSTAVPIAFDAYKDNRETGAFILVDRYTDQTVAAGMIDFALRRATNIHREPFAVDKVARARLKNQRPCIVWFTGLPASGKSTIARLIEQRMSELGHHTYVLDGDNLRHGLTRDLGFTDADRVENIRRAGEVARLFLDAGLIVLCAFISPFRAERQMIRDLVEPGEFLEVFVDTPLEECERRDPKGLYAKARAGAIPNFTGIGSLYEAPEAPDIVVRTPGTAPAQLAEQMITRLQALGYIG